MDRQAITADCFWSAGYLATSGEAGQRERRLLPQFVGVGSSVDLAEHDVHGADDGHRVGDHVAARHLVQRRQVGEARRADLQR
jgi:hypothetical protein